MAEVAKEKKEKKAHPRDRLTPVMVKKAKPGRHADGGGLYLEVKDTGARRWFLRVMLHGRRQDVGLGPTGLVTLAEARELARELRKVAKAGGDPVAHRDRNKRTSLTFEEAARKVHAEHIVPTANNAKHKDQWLNTLTTYAFPVIGSRPVHAVEQADILRVLAPIWTDKPETARRLRQRLRTVLDWARTAGLRDGVNPVEGVEKGLPRQKDKPQHHAALPWAEVPAVLRRIEAVAGMGALALRFSILTAARSGEVRGATWEEFDLEAGVWVVPAARMKAGVEHRVPLAPAAVAVLRAAKALATREEALAFPSAKPGKPLSDMTLAAVLKRLEVPVTVHGFRSSFRDWAEEATHFPHEVKESALAHTVKNRVEAAYRRTDLFDKRRQMMAAWADFIMAEGGKVVRLGA